MAVSTSKEQLLDQLEQERAIWEGLLTEIGPERMEVPGVTGDWTMKDTIAHMTTWWRRGVAMLAAVERDQRPPEHLPQSQVPIINEWIHLTNRDRPLADVLRDSQEVWQQFVGKLQTLPEDTLFDRERFVWTDGRAVGPGSLEDFTIHLHKEHEPLIRSWLRQQKNH